MGKIVLSYLVAVAMVLTYTATPVAAANKPNLLFMMADQMREDVLTNPGVPLPGLRAMAAEGVKFLNAYTTTPTCTPARAAILTGQKPWNHGMLGYGAVAEQYPFEMPRALASVGYTTTSIGKDHFGWNTQEHEGVPHGFQNTSIYDGISSEPDNYHTWFQNVMGGKEPESGWPTLDMNSWRGAPYVYNESYHPTAWVGRQAVEFLESYDKQEPYFLKVSFHRPHSPYDPPQRCLDMISADVLPEIAVSKDHWDDRFMNETTQCGPSSPDAWCGKMPDDEATLARRAYLANIVFIDEWVAKIFDTLRTRGFLNNTYVIWTADHGDGQSDHWHWRKGYPYEASAHIPMLLRWPDGVTYPTARGAEKTEPTELRDVFPTMLDAAGGNNMIPSNYSMDGASLLCLLDPERAGCQPWREWIDLEHSTCYNMTNHWNALTDGEMKYIFKAWNASEQLFNLTESNEMVDLASDPSYADNLAMWRARLVAQYEKEQRGPVWVQDGKLMQRIAGQTYSPNYPGSNPPGNQTCWSGDVKVDAAIVLEPHQDENPTYCQDFKLETSTDFSDLRFIANSSLCLSVSASDATALTVELCEASAAAQNFAFEQSTGDASKALVHVPSKQCVVATSRSAVSLAPCSGSSTKWVFGQSGRICSDGDGNNCISILPDTTAAELKTMRRVRPRLSFE